MTHTSLVSKWRSVLTSLNGMPGQGAAQMTPSLANHSIGCEASTQLDISRCRHGYHVIGHYQSLKVHRLLLGSCYLYP